jgi:hypothetical protein
VPYGCGEHTRDRVPTLRFCIVPETRNRRPEAAQHDLTGPLASEVGACFFTCLPDQFGVKLDRQLDLPSISVLDGFSVLEEPVKFLLYILAAVILTAVQPADAQQPTKVPRIGYLSGSGSGFAVEAFRQGLRDLGYIEGKTILFEYRSAEGKLDRIPVLVAELVHLKVDVLVSTVEPAIETAK